uniref:Uncharacterized protein n=1 Tax=Plectus sambesii TaxID=2011161 RepID=A0A914XCH9_9BILA
MKAFDDYTSDCVTFPSNWLKERKTKTNESQTGATDSKEAECQSFERISVEMQADLTDSMTFVENPDWVRVSAFLKRTEPLVMKALEQNLRSVAAFDRYIRIMAADHDATLRKTHSLKHKAVSDEMAVLSVDWNSSGTTVLAGYGVPHHDDWCAHKGCICTWNMERRKLDPAKADVCVDMDACVTVVRFHPRTPGLLAAATFSGQLVVCNLANPGDSVVIFEGKPSDNSHKQPVTCLEWLPKSDGNREFSLVSAAQDGRILVWNLPSRGAELQLAAAFAINVGSLPRLLRGKVTNLDKEAGLTGLALSSKESDLFLAAGETGALLHCNMNAKDPVGQLGDCTLHNPVVLGLRPHNGTVYCVRASPSHRNLFLTVSGDGCVRICNILKMDALINVDLGSGYLYSASWSPVRPTVFAVATGDGHVALFDLMVSQAAPIANISCDTDKKPVHSVAFNARRPDTLVCGDGKGVLTVWQLGSRFVTAPGDEMAKLDSLAVLAQDND